VPGAATTIYRSSSSDVSLSMAQRLGEACPVQGCRPKCLLYLSWPFVPAARRFKQQIFLAVDVPPSFMALGDGPRLIMAVEKAVVDVLKSLETSTS
jgi:proteasome assembly chaperone 4